MTLDWTDSDSRAVDVARILAVDAVEKVGNGHPGTPVSLAPLAYLLYQKVMHLDPTDDMWLGRDRFVLSAGHASLTQYTQLYLAGCDMELDDIKSLRTWGSKTPGHPEFHHTKFVECTTGPLGAGISNAVGMAVAARKERGLFDPDAPAGESPFDRTIYCIAGDGCLQEGISSEASSLAATQNLGNLVLFYDDNRITIEGGTNISFTEDVSARYAAYGWHVQHVDWTNGGTEYVEDMDALNAAIEEAASVTDKPSFIRLTTVIGWPLPNKAGDHSVHGSKIGADEISALKKELDFPDEPFTFDESIVEGTRANVAERGRAARKAWDAKFATWQQANPERNALLERVRASKLPEDLSLPVFSDAKMSTRKASGEVLSALASQLPELWGGSADLAGSNNTTMKGEPSFLPESRQTPDWQGNQYGRTLHFGIREHAMGGIVNGITLSGLTRAYGGTFLVFSDYMRPAVRLAAIMGIRSTFVWTHDSVGVGEDGPTHQPVEHLAALRAIPNLDVVRPADANETSVAWGEILRRNDNPAGLILSRQDLRNVDRGEEFASADGVANGAYVLREASGDVALIIIATGSEVEVALDAQDKLEAKGISTRVVSMPCQEWFDKMDPEYKESVLPAAVTARVSVEAGISMGWAKYVGTAGATVSLEHFGASASGAKCFEEFGFTGAHVAEVASSLV
ncbi:transketolase [Tessaracoccus antarcticus]|uniref:Transketolase n=1 Tax=Tessaracoccus antarcticus TaxID=2479848 RepID=A0A3M0G0C7_9ACTN|nr:transketolase [Tessaracoccus antarcticus]RMB58410.1 transketolase [Tessaracoccus antarcticus]